MRSVLDQVRDWDKYIGDLLRDVGLYIGRPAQFAPRVDKPFFDRLRDWDWNPWDLLYYVFDVSAYHIQRLGWIGWILVPATIWFILMAFRPTRYLVSLITVDVYRATLSNLVSGIFRHLEAAAKLLFGLGVARLRGTARWVSNWFRS